MLRGTAPVPQAGQAKYVRTGGARPPTGPRERKNIHKQRFITAAAAVAVATGKKIES